VADRGSSRAIRELVRQVPRRSYALTKWRMLRRMERRTEDPIVVFCMSKTASTAIVRAVQNADPRPVYKIHLLTAEGVAQAEAQYRRTDPSARPRHILHASHLLRHLPTPEHPWQVVTIVREPIARAASEFFQSGERLGHLGDETTIEARCARFAMHQGIPRTIDWFERELEPTLGIDVYAHPFDPATGYSVIETPAVRMLILRQESLPVAPQALREFLGLSHDLNLARENEGSRKEYSDLYAAVLRDVRFPVDALDLAYGSRFAQHFYSVDEIDDLRGRWGHADH
jgi:hypothetical protein